MPTVELTDEQLRLLQTAEKIGGMAGLDNMYKSHTAHTQLLGNPKLRSNYEAILKAQFPQITTAADVAAPYVEKLTGLEKRITELMDNQAKEKHEALQAKRQADFESNWAQMVKDHSLTDEGQEAIAKYMRDKNLHDPESAALSYFKHNPKPEPIQPAGGLSPQSWGIGPLPGEDEADGKLLMEQPERWADKEAYATLNEIRRAAA